jgi:serine/threonine-protein phosphatase PGAM5
MGERILYLLRHGQLDMRAFAKDEIRAGLTDIGREQAEITAECLRSLDVDAIYSSTLGRALETAVIISKRFPNTVVRRSDLLRELPNLGHPNFADGKRRGERAFARFVRPTRQKQRIDIVISHGNVIRYFACRALQLPAESWSVLGSSHCGITQMRVGEGIVQIVGYNQVTHLPSRLRL